MIDLHTHILPGIDDGSRDIIMTQQMLLEERQQGIDTVVATPHFYADQMAVESFLRRREQAMDKVNSLLQSVQTAPEQTEPEQAAAASGQSRTYPRILSGAEVYYFDGMGSAGMLGQLCLEGTNCLLLEMPFTQWTKSICRDVEEIIDRQGLRIILAHLERYVSFQKDKTWWDEILQLPVMIQLNAGSFLNSGMDAGGMLGGLFGGRLLRANKKHRFCMQLLQQAQQTDRSDARGSVLLGSDCHNITSRRPNLAAAREEIAAGGAERAFEAAQQLAEEVLGL